MNVTVAVQTAQGKTRLTMDAMQSIGPKGKIDKNKSRPRLLIFTMFTVEPVEAESARYRLDDRRSKDRRSKDGCKEQKS